MIGHRIRQSREQRGITLAVLAQRAGISKSFLSEVESGTRSIEVTKVIAIARILKIRMDWLFEMSERTVCQQCNGSGFVQEDEQ